MPTSEDAAGAYLAKTVLRDFGQPVPREDRVYSLPTFIVSFEPGEAPVPVLLRYALTLIGIRHEGPVEKVAWWVTFTYKGYPCELSHEKFGVRLRVGGDLDEGQALKLLTTMKKKLVSAVKKVEALLAETAGDTLNAGDVTVVNQHLHLRRAYDYFRRRATDPDLVEDRSESGKSDTGEWWSFLSGKNVMALNASHDLVAAISAFMSMLEHDLVLALPFVGFDPSEDELTKIIGDRWGEKWRRVIGQDDPEAVKLHKRLVEVVERWRNPYSHGGFEKGHGATVYLHTAGLGALRVGLTGIRDSPLFAFHSVSETDIEGVFELFDEIEGYLARVLAPAVQWIDSGLEVRFDEVFRAEVMHRLELEGNLEKLIDEHAYDQDVIENMDF